MRMALDTNFLVYAEGVNDGAKGTTAERIVKNAPVDTTFIPVQALGELFHVLVGKARRTPDSARKSIVAWQNSFPVIETSHSILLAAVDLSADFKLHIWDAVILASAASSTCRLLLTEDMREGFTWGGVTVANPFAVKKHELVRALLSE